MPSYGVQSLLADHVGQLRPCKLRQALLFGRPLSHQAVPRGIVVDAKVIAASDPDKLGIQWAKLCEREREREEKESTILGHMQIKKRSGRLHVAVFFVQSS